jgi:glycerol-1-phosphate dehydrogenase [NAD(P)+]
MPPRDAIELLLAGQYPDPVTGELIAAETRAVVIEDSLAGREVELVAALGLGRRVAIVSDRTTHGVLGARVEQALASHFTIQSLVLDAGPHPDEATVERILASLAPGTDLVIAVGSGTLNDLAKMVAFRRGCPQAVFATAPSMNGYTSLSASIKSGGIKRSVRTRTPIAAYFDLSVIAAAPPRLILAGLGDSACRSTAQADWLLSHLLLDRPYRDVPFALLADDERSLFAHAAALRSGDLAAIRYLVRTLVLSGIGMTISGGSFPASQGEHLLSHYIEMVRPSHDAESFHGEQIGVCTIAMAGLQERMLARETPPRLRPNRLERDELVRRFGPESGAECWSELSQKRFGEDQTAALNARLDQHWDAMRARIAAISLGPTALRGVLAAGGAPVGPAELGWSDAVLEDAMVHAREIRNRYTFLDLAADGDLGM